MPELWYYGSVKHEFIAIFELGDDGWWAATCPEIPGTIGQGRTQEAARSDLASSVQFMLEHLRDEAVKNLAPSAQRGTVLVG